MCQTFQGEHDQPQRQHVAWFHDPGAKGPGAGLGGVEFQHASRKTKQTPWKIYMLNLKMKVWKVVTFSFQVNVPGCIS